MMCLSLLKSLSMFTLLRCYIIVSGRGKLVTGMTIRFNRKDKQKDNLLGFVVSGMFSQSKGCYHGSGYICSKRFLSHLSEGEHGSFVLQKQTHGTSVVALKVHIYCESKSVYSMAYITILP